MHAHFSIEETPLWALLLNTAPEAVVGLHVRKLQAVRGGTKVKTGLV